MFYKQIYREIKKSKKIVIARHIGPDPDALGSSIGLKESILTTFPEKEVYVVGASSWKLKFLGELDIYEDHMNDALLLVTDTPDLARVDIPYKDFKNIIKIDHHPFVEKYASIEWINTNASSASEMVLDLIFNTNLVLTPTVAEKIYAGIVADTGRFMFGHLDKTFYLVSKMLEETKINTSQIYNDLYTRSYKEIKFQGYMSQNFTITDNKVGYIIIDDDILSEYSVDAATAGNMINDFNHIEQMMVWLTATYDKELQTYRVSIRSRNIAINEVASRHRGGGHANASGARLKTKEEIKLLIDDLDKAAAKYLND